MFTHTYINVTTEPEHTAENLILLSYITTPLALITDGPTIQHYLWNEENISGEKNVSPAASGRTKGFAFCSRLVWHAHIVCRFGIDGVAPPRQNRVLADRAVLGVLQSKEDDHGTNGITRV